MTVISDHPMTREISHEDKNLGTCWIRNPGYRSDQIDIPMGMGIYQTRENGELIQSIVNAVHQAKDMICLSSFLLQSTHITDALFEVAERGIRVYVLTAPENRLSREPEDMSEYDRDVVKEHIALLDEFAGKILVRVAQHFHAKFILVDPKSTDARGFLLTANLTKKILRLG